MCMSVNHMVVEARREYPLGLEVQVVMCYCVCPENCLSSCLTLFHGEHDVASFMT